MITVDEFLRNPKKAFYTVRFEGLPKDALREMLLSDSGYREFIFDTLAHDFSKDARFDSFGNEWVVFIRELPALHREFFLALARRRHAAEWSSKFLAIFGSEYTAELAALMPGYFEPESIDDETF